MWKKTSPFTTTLCNWTQQIFRETLRKKAPRSLPSMLTPGSTCLSQLSGCGWWNLTVLTIEDLPTADPQLRRHRSRGDFRSVLVKYKIYIKYKIYSLSLIWFAIRTSWLTLQRTSILKLDPASMKSYVFPFQKKSSEGTCSNGTCCSMHCAP